MLFESSVNTESSVNDEYVLFQLDQQLQETSYVYKSFRVKNSISPLQVYTVPSGTFLQLKKSLVENRSVSPNQFKVPRVLKDAEVIQFMFHCYNSADNHATEFLG